MRRLRGALLMTIRLGTRGACSYDCLRCCYWQGNSCCCCISGIYVPGMDLVASIQGEGWGRQCQHVNKVAAIGQHVNPFLVQHDGDAAAAIGTFCT